jgi:hypothetical protein
LETYYDFNQQFKKELRQRYFQEGERQFKEVSETPMVPNSQPSQEPAEPVETRSLDTRSNIPLPPEEVSPVTSDDSDLPDISSQSVAPNFGLQSDADRVLWTEPRSSDISNVNPYSVCYEDGSCQYNAAKYVLDRIRDAKDSVQEFFTGDRELNMDRLRDKTEKELEDLLKANQKKMQDSQTCLYICPSEKVAEDNMKKILSELEDRRNEDLFKKGELNKEEEENLAENGGEVESSKVKYMCQENGKGGCKDIKEFQDLERCVDDGPYNHVCEKVYVPVDESSKQIKVGDATIVVPGAKGETPVENSEIKDWKLLDKNQIVKTPGGKIEVKSGVDVRQLPSPDPKGSVDVGPQETYVDVNPEVKLIPDSKGCTRDC